MFMTSPKPVEGGEQALLTQLASAEKMAVAEPAAPRQVSWPYASFGQPGKGGGGKEITDLDTVFVRFENGVRLTMKPTKFRNDEVLVRVNIGDGLEDLPRDSQSLCLLLQRLHRRRAEADHHRGHRAGAGRQGLRRALRDR